MINIQEHLLYLTDLEIKRENYKKIRGVTSFWREVDHTACISFYFDGEITEEDIDVASNICVYIIAHFPDGLLEEHFYHLNFPIPLPESPFWAYKREDEIA